MTTVRLKLSDAAVRRYAADPAVRELKDQGRPLVLRYWRQRDRASWYLVHRERWHKLGNWPGLSAAAAADAIPERLQLLATNPQATVAMVGMRTAGQLLDWYADRVSRDRNLSKSRKATVSSLIKNHLRPRLVDVQLEQLDRPTLDRLLFWPMQETHSVAYVRQAYGVLRKATKKAHTLNEVAIDPLAGLVFTEFIEARITEREGRLQGEAVGQLLEHWAAVYRERPADVALAVMMLSHASRVGETRQARWADIQREARIWHIPANRTKTNQELRLPLTLQVVAFLDRYRATQQAAGYRGELLFPRRSKGHPLGARKASEVFTSLSSGEWTSHDLRKLARTVWAEIGIDFLMGELLLNHALDGVKRAYIQTHAATGTRLALEQWHAFLDARGFASLHAETGPRPAVTGNTRQAAPSVGWL